MKKNKKIILSLIKDDLTNTKLINGLIELGLDAGKYYLHPSQTFFALMGFGEYQRDNKLYDEYFDFVEKETTMDILKNPEYLDATALEVYNKLIAEKEKRKIKKIRKTK